ncbi:MAG: hypothetical protein AB8B64_25540 [Granulosicoccus sp.]
MRTCLPIMLALMILSACDNGVSLSEPHSHSHESVSGIRDGIWPPQPLNMENVERLPTRLRPRARQSVVEIARRSVMNNPDVLNAIGENYGIFGASLSLSKSDTDVARFVFYNYETDQTVEAILNKDGNVNVSSLSASEWQPTENPLEIQQAISLARTSLESDGFDLDSLQGTAMMTYPAQTSSSASTPMFYDTRMLYVTFGMGDGEPPLYSARVDIGAGVTLERGPLQ